MPNHITNILLFDCSENRSRDILEFVRGDDGELGSIDFNKLIPMPESLKITSGSETYTGIEIYLTAVNPSTKDFGYPKLTRGDFWNLYSMLNIEKSSGKYNAKLSDGIIQQHIKSSSLDYYFKTGEAAANNMKQYGATTWYPWCINNWGSKWNAYNCLDVNPEEGCMTFMTAWSGVPQIVQKISENFPDVLIHYSWADENIGYNTGRIDYRGGKEILMDIPEGGSRHAFEIAGCVQGFDLDELGIYDDNSQNINQKKSRENDER